MEPDDLVVKLVAAAARVSWIRQAAATASMVAVPEPETAVPDPVAKTFASQCWISVRRCAGTPRTVLLLAAARPPP